MFSMAQAASWGAMAWSFRLVTSTRAVRKMLQLAADQFAQLLQQLLVGDDIEVVLLRVHGAGGIAARLYNGGQSGAVQGVRPKGPAAAPVQQQI